jgi:hypothetical protein
MRLPTQTQGGRHHPTGPLALVYRPYHRGRYVSGLDPKVVFTFTLNPNPGKANS